MSYEAAVEVGVDLIAPACTLFTVWYFFHPWSVSHVGRAIMAHSVGSMLLFDLALLAQYDVIPEMYPGHHAVTLTIVVLWIIGWWYMVAALWLTSREARKKPASSG
jgi:hypothetical protein